MPKNGFRKCIIFSKKASVRSCLKDGYQKYSATIKNSIPILIYRQFEIVSIDYVQFHIYNLHNEMSSTIEY